MVSSINKYCVIHSTQNKNRMKTKTLILRRVSDDGTQTIGKMELYDGRRSIDMFYTLELTDNDNAPNISRIPAGEYQVRIRKSPKFATHFIVNGVKGRKYILIHKGNTYKSTRGCILIGTDLGDIDGDSHPDIVKSGQALNRLLSYGTGFKLIVKDEEV